MLSVSPLATRCGLGELEPACLSAESVMLPPPLSPSLNPNFPAPRPAPPPAEVARRRQRRDPRGHLCTPRHLAGGGTYVRLPVPALWARRCVPRGRGTLCAVHVGGVGPGTRGPPGGGLGLGGHWWREGGLVLYLWLAGQVALLAVRLGLHPRNLLSHLPPPAPPWTPAQLPPAPTAASAARPTAAAPWTPSPSACATTGGGWRCGGLGTRPGTVAPSRATRQRRKGGCTPFACQAGAGML